MMDNKELLIFVERMVLEMRDSISGMLATGESLFTALDEMNNETFREQSARLTRNLCRLMRFSDNITALSSLVNSERIIDPVDTDISEWMSGFASELRPFIEASGKSSLYEGMSAPMILAVDTALLRDALLNLISNSLCATEPGGEIKLKISKEADSALFTVSDKGKGIPAKIADTIFMRYSQQTEPYLHEGLGVGLALAKAVAEAHSGRFLLTGSEGHGITATLSIPFSRSGNLKASPSPFDVSSGFSPILIQLSKQLPVECYMYFY